MRTTQQSYIQYSRDATLKHANRRHRTLTDEKSTVCDYDAGNMKKHAIVSKCQKHTFPLNTPEPIKYGIKCVLVCDFAPTASAVRSKITNPTENKEGYIIFHNRPLTNALQQCHLGFSIIVQNQNPRIIYNTDMYMTR